MRRIGEETTQTNAQAAVIALTALQEITRGGGAGGTKKAKEPRGAVNQAELDGGLEHGDQYYSEDENGVVGGALGANAISLKTLTPSRFVKISNVWNRDFELSERDEQELREDFCAELNSVTKFKTLTVVTKDLVCLGAE